MSLRKDDKNSAHVIRNGRTGWVVLENQSDEYKTSARSDCVSAAEAKDQRSHRRAFL